MITILIIETFSQEKNLINESRNRTEAIDEFKSAIQDISFGISQNNTIYNLDGTVNINIDFLNIPNFNIKKITGVIN